jgi:hypothetical protein
MYAEKQTIARKSIYNLVNETVRKTKKAPQANPTGLRVVERDKSAAGGDVFRKGYRVIASAR